MKTVKQSFEIGWLDGWRHGTALTRREATEMYPDCDIDAVVEGSIDGAVNETWRLEGKGEQP